MVAVLSVQPLFELQGQCSEAFDFYASTRGGKVTAAISFGEGPAYLFGIPWMVNVIPGGDWRPAGSPV